MSDQKRLQKAADELLKKSWEQNKDEFWEEWNRMRKNSAKLIEVVRLAHQSVKTPGSQGNDSDGT